MSSTRKTCMEQKLTGRLPGALEHMSSVSGETEITGVVWPGEGQGRSHCFIQLHTGRV